MHEMSYVVRLVNQALDIKKEQAGKVPRLFVSVGEMTGVLPEYLYKYYPQAVEGTEIEGSELVVETVEAQVECAGCGGVYRPTRENKYLCPDCGDGHGRVIDGRDVRLERVEMS